MPETFREFGLRSEVQRALDEAEYETATPIQQKAIPFLLGGSDLIGVAATGTGKTLAFLLPIFEKLESGHVDPQGLVICPTRELAIQVAGEADRFGAHLGVRTVLAYGGTSSNEQKRLLREGCDLVVGTPGRLLDFVQSAWLSLRKLKFLVLDEADRMLDMGFINDVDAILRETPMSRQTALFSATFPDEIKNLSERFMLYPEMVKMHQGTRVTKTVEHAFFPVAQQQKDELLLRLLDRANPKKGLIFTATREATSEVAQTLRRRRYNVISLSSLLSQANRERALDVFRRGECDILVATDVAARGLDIDDIDLVVNYDVPMHGEDYVHRIGRTGRAKREGRAITLVSERDEERSKRIEKLLGSEIERVILEDFNYMERKPFRKGAGGRGGPSRGRGGSGGGRGGSGGGRGGGGSGGGGRGRSSGGGGGSRGGSSGGSSRKRDGGSGSGSGAGSSSGR